MKSVRSNSNRHNHQTGSGVNARMRRRGSEKRRQSGRRLLRMEPLEERALLAGAPVQVLLMIGQFNLAGYGSNLDLGSPYDAPQSDVWIWQNDLGPNVGWTSHRGGFGADSSNHSLGGDGPRFGPEVGPAKIGRAWCVAVLLSGNIEMRAPKK